MTIKKEIIEQNLAFDETEKMIYSNETETVRRRIKARKFVILKNLQNARANIGIKSSDASELSKEIKEYGSSFYVFRDCYDMGFMAGYQKALSDLKKEGRAEK